MRTEDKTQNPNEGMQLIFNHESSITPSSSRSSSCSSTSSSSSRDSSSSSRSPSVSHSHGSHYSSSSSSNSRSRSRSYPRCCRVSDHSRCRQRRRSSSSSPYPRRSYRYGRRRESCYSSPSSSRKGYYRRSGRSRSRSSSHGRTGGAYVGRFRCRFSPSPVRYSRRRSRSPGCSVRLSQKDKVDLLNIARENAAKVLGADVVKLPASVRFFEEAVKNSLKANTRQGVSVDPVTPKNPLQGNTTAVEDNEVFITSTARKSITFSLSNAVAKPSCSLTLTESKVTSRADSVGNRKPYGQWIPVKTVSVKKR